MDTLGPAAHTLLPPSRSPIVPPPSPRRAPRRSLLALPASLPIPSDSAPTDSPAGSTLHNSATALRTPALFSAVSSAPAPQTAPVCTSPPHTPPPSHSIPPVTICALLLIEGLSRLPFASDQLSSPPASPADIPPAS